MTDLPLSPAEQEAMEAEARRVCATDLGRSAYRAGWLAARNYYAEQSEAFAAGQKMEWDAMTRRLEEADQRNALLLKTANERAEELDEAEQRERALTEALLAARADILGVNAAAFDSTRGEVACRAIARIDAALAAHPETEGHDG